MRKAKHRRMHVRRNVYANRYVKKTGVNLFAVIVIIGLAVALGFLMTNMLFIRLYSDKRRLLTSFSEQRLQRR